MGEETDAFFLVRKGGIVGVFKSLSECQAQVSSSITDPPVGIYKGYSLPKDAEEHLISHGLQNALYTIKASDLKDGLFGTLKPCPFQEPSSTKGESSSMDLPQKRPHNALGSGNVGTVGSTVGPLSKHQKLGHLSSEYRAAISFSDADLEGLHPHHNDALVLRVMIANWNVRRVLIASGSCADIMTKACYAKMQLSEDHLRPWNSPLYFFGNKAIIPKGMIELPVMVGEGIYQREIMVDFMVVDVKLAYNVILGSRFLTKLEGVVSIRHLMIKYPIPKAGIVGSVKGDQKMARECFNIAQKMGEECYVITFKSCNF